jgi:excisionase family DNA binding protein
MAAKPIEQELIDITQAAKLLGTTVRHMRNLVADDRDDRIPFGHVGRLLRFDPLAVAAWWQRHQGPLVH